MSTPSMGFLFIPSSNINNMEILQYCLKALGSIEQVRDVFIVGENTANLSQEQACTLLSRNKRGGSISIDIAGFNTEIWFTPDSTQSAEGYQYLRIEVPYWEFAEIEGDPMRVELFAMAWVHLCETLHVQAAYFHSHNAGKIENIAQACINKLHKGAFWEFTRTRYWRCYLAPSAAAEWQNQNRQAEHSWAESLEALHSGALVLSRNEYYNPELGNNDALLNTRFLIQQLSQHPEICNMNILLKILHQEGKRLLRIESDGIYTKHGAEAQIDYEGLTESRTILDEVRATWACALHRPGLVGVQQIFSNAAEHTEVVVPIVADNGREWMLPTLLYPFNLASTKWNDLETGLRARVQRLQETAQQYKIADKPPRVGVYFWRGVTTEVQEALNAMHAGIEIADRLPLLK